MFQVTAMSRPTNWGRFKALLWKSFHNQKKRPILLYGRTLLTTVCSLLMVYFHKNEKLSIRTTTTSWSPDNIYLCSNRSLRDTMYCEVPHREVFYTPDVNISRKVMEYLRDNMTNIGKLNRSRALKLMLVY